MQKNSKIKVHKDSEIWEYEGKIEFTQELVDFFDEERRRTKREKQSEFRHIAFEKIDDESVYSSIVNKPATISEQAEANVLLKQVNDALSELTDIEKRRFILNKIVGLKLVEIAKLEDVSETAVRKTINSVQKKINERINYY